MDTNAEQAYIRVMTNEQFPFRSPAEVARTVGRNVETTLHMQGHDMDWLAQATDISVAGLLAYFTNGVPAWLTLDLADALNTRVDRLIEAS